jgi:hypothetical protein
MMRAISISMNYIIRNDQYEIFEDLCYLNGKARKSNRMKYLRVYN